MSRLKIWDRADEENTTYLELRPNGIDSAILVARNKNGSKMSALASINKKGLRRSPLFRGNEFGMKQDACGRVNLRDDPLTSEVQHMKYRIAVLEDKLKLKAKNERITEECCTCCHCTAARR